MRGSNDGSLPRLAAQLAGAWWPQLAALAAACGIVATTITGSLGVGDAIESGLRDMALGRLGRIEAAVAGEGFFPASLADRLRTDGGPAAVVPAIVMPVTVSAGGSTARGTLLACDDPAGLGFRPAPPPLAATGVFVNPPLAETLGLSPGGAVVLRLPRPSRVPPDSPLGRRTDESDGRRLTVAAVLPAEGLGGFSLRPVQSTGPLVVTSLRTAQSILRREGGANMVFLMTAADDGGPANPLPGPLPTTLADFGLELEQATREPPSLRLVSDRLILPPAVDAACDAILTPLGGQPTLVFLANALTPLDGSEPAAASIPYSTVLGIASTSLPVGDLVDDSGVRLALPAADEILIDRWMADDLAAQGRPVAVGDRLRLRFFQPETMHGRVVETAADLRIIGIAAMRGAAIAKELVPEVEGITDEDSIADWDPPFPFDASRVRSTPPHDEDDRYWKQYRATPKAFVSLTTSRRLAGSRFGDSTAWLVPGGPEHDAPAIAARIAAAIRPDMAGLRILPLRADALAAARGSTPFGSLFLALSSFVIAAGLLLEALLVSLLVAARRKDLGVLAAVGFPPKRLALLLVIAGGFAVLAGVAGGAVLGPVWGRALLAWLGAAWTADVEAGAAAAFQGGRMPGSRLLAAAAAAILVSLAALAAAAWRAASRAPLELLRGGERAPGTEHRTRRTCLMVAACGLAVAGGAAAAGRASSAAMALGLFFAAGFGGLAGSLALARLWLGATPPATGVRSLLQLARRNLAFAPTRGFSVAALVASAAFLIVAVSSFAQRPPADPGLRSSPTGGWTEIVSFGSATAVDPTHPDARGSLGISAAQEALLEACDIVRLRSSDGDDAACTNLYATNRPTVVGVGPDFIERGGFSFVAHAALPHGSRNPWELLNGPASDAAIPAILDQATAQWGLKLGGVGSRFTVPDDRGEPVACTIVGLLAPGILQGRVIVAERGFERMFPDRSGYGMALVDANAVPAADRPAVAAALAAAWADAGVAITEATKRLASLQAVQNTFLSGFQVLGTLGLLLGTAGVAAVQLQGVWERIGPLAVLRAVGFTLGRTRWLLVCETIVTVVVGLSVGIAAACLAVAPALASGQASLPVTWIGITVATTLAAAGTAAAFAAGWAMIPSRPPQD